MWPHELVPRVGHSADHRSLAVSRSRPQSGPRALGRGLRDYRLWACWPVLAVSSSWFLDNRQFRPRPTPDWTSIAGGYCRSTQSTSVWARLARRLTVRPLVPVRTETGWAVGSVAQAVDQRSLADSRARQNLSHTTLCVTAPAGTYR